MGTPYTFLFWGAVESQGINPVCVGGEEGAEQHMARRRAALVLVLPRLSSRDMAALGGEVTRSPLEASKHYCP